MLKEFFYSRPVIFCRYGRYIFLNYGLYNAAGFSLSLLIFLFLIAHYQPITVFSCLFIATTLLFNIVIFAKIYYWLMNIKRLFQDPLAVFAETGFAFTGVLIGIVVSLAILSKLYAIHIIVIADWALLSLPLGMIITRLGCMNYGCCFGIESDSVFAIKYKDKHAKAVRVAGDNSFFPSQWLMVQKNILLTVIVWSLFFYAAQPGFITLAWAMAYSCLRFFIDYTRNSRGFENFYCHDLRGSQVFCLFLFFSALASAFLLPTLQLPIALATALSVTTIVSIFITCLLAFLLFFMVFGIHVDEIGKHYLRKK